MPGQKGAFGIIRNTDVSQWKLPLEAAGIPRLVQFGELEQSLQLVHRVLGTDKLVLTMTSMPGAQILRPGDTKANEMIPAK